MATRLHYCSRLRCDIQRRERGDRPPTDEEKQSALVNKPPGAPPLTILSFKRAFHGRTMGQLALLSSHHLSIYYYYASGGYWHGYLSGARCRLAYGPADATATYCLLLQ